MVYNVRIHKAAMVLLAGAFMFAASSSQASSIFRRGSSDPEAPDAITDFADSGPFGDYVVLAKICEDTCTFIGTESFSGTAGEVRYEVIEKDEQTITDLSVDRNGDGAADFVADLLGSHSLTTANVLFR